MTAPFSDFTSLSLEDLKKRYTSGPAKLDSRVLELPEEQLTRTFSRESGMGMWSSAVVIGHLADAELAFVHRMRRAAAEEMPAFCVWDEDAFVARGLYNSKDSVQALRLCWESLQSLRKWTSLWLAELPSGDFERKGMHPERGEQTIRIILAYATWHMEHHGWFLNQKVAAILGNADRA
jgi:uncharacterized damage-inducible protein DinB